MSQSLEDVVSVVIDNFMQQSALFTALDVTNEVKKTMPFARHTEIRDIVRELYNTTIQNGDYTRTNITVTLMNGRTRDAFLYHPLSDSWDLDTKYDAQKRTQVAATSMASITTPPIALPPVTTAAAAAPVVVASPPAPAKPVDPKQMWDNLFGTTKLFPTV